MGNRFFYSMALSGSSSSSPSGYPSNQSQVPGEELRSILRVTESHSNEFGDALRAVVAFGPIVTAGNTYDIDLLEIVDGWTGQRAVKFANSQELPLRGELTLYFMSTDEFEDPAKISNEQDRQRIESILSQVSLGYQVVLERPFDYFEDALRLATEKQLGVISVSSGGPLSFVANIGKGGRQ